MVYTYIIRSRVPGCPTGDELYRGVCEASTFKEAILNALAVEFGDPSDGSPYEQITNSWMDQKLFDAQYVNEKDDITNFELDAGECFFDIEVKRLTS